METTSGRKITKIEFKFDQEGWTWEIQDSEIGDDDILSVKDITKLNKRLVKFGLKIDPLTLNYPITQTLCG